MEICPLEVDLSDSVCKCNRRRSVFCNRVFEYVSESSRRRSPKKDYSNRNAVENIHAAGRISGCRENENPIDEMNASAERTGRGDRGDFRKSNTGGEYRGCSKTESPFILLGGRGWL